MRHFCTYFDKNYLSRGLALYHSLRAHHPSFRLYVCCFDKAAHAYLQQLALPEVVAILHTELETHDPELATTRAHRSMVEYYFTSTPCWIRFVLDRFPEIDLVTYVDADLRFFSSSEPIFAELKDGSVAIVDHRFPPALKHLEDRGRFNVGWLSFRRDDQGMACVRWWRERCIEWCFDRLEGDRYADQKYLDQWPTLFRGVVVLQHKGVNVAPWNLDAARVRVEDGALRIDGAPLICFHFHGLKHVVGRLYESGLRAYDGTMNGVVRRHIYEPYFAELLHHERELQRAGVTAGHATSRRQARAGGLGDRVRKWITVGRLLLSRTYLMAPRLGRSP
jgi:hypothetical protein